MLNFEIDVLMGEEPVTLQVEELDSWADADGYLRYKVKLGRLTSVIAFDTRYWKAPLLITPEDVDDYYEIIHYPDVPKFYSDNNNFMSEEIGLIRMAIGKYIIDHGSRH